MLEIIKIGIKIMMKFNHIKPFKLSGNSKLLESSELIVMKIAQDVLNSTSWF